MKSKDNSLYLRIEESNFINEGNIHDHIINGNLSINSNKKLLKKNHKSIKKRKFKVLKSLANINID